jgi:hypothetical protein
MRSDSSWLSPFIGVLKWNVDVSSNDHEEKFLCIFSFFICNMESNETSTSYQFIKLCFYKLMGCRVKFLQCLTWIKENNVTRPRHLQSELFNYIFNTCNRHFFFFEHDHKENNYIANHLPKQNGCLFIVHQIINLVL